VDTGGGSQKHRRRPRLSCPGPQLSGRVPSIFLDVIDADRTVAAGTKRAAVQLGRPYRPVSTVNLIRPALGGGLVRPAPPRLANTNDLATEKICVSDNYYREDIGFPL